MLTESVSDPRRANWLTISMSEDICWPEDNNNSRPNWELEAEILRLTTRLMMRERELQQVKNQLKTQVTKSQQQALSWKKKIEEKEKQMRNILRQKDSEMQGIVSQLLLFESELRKEQTRIESLLHEKDVHIQSQEKELRHLKEIIEAQVASFTKSDLDKTKRSSTSSLEGGDALRRMTIPRSGSASSYEESAVLRSKSILRNSSIRSFNSDARTSAISKNGTIRSFNDSDTFKTTTIRRNGSIRSFEDSDRTAEDNSLANGVKGQIFTDDKSREVAQKTRDRHLKMRGIQDVTNVKKSLDLFCDPIVDEKKRVPYRPPQKMKDLKAKRINSQNKIHRPVINEISAQTIL